MSVTTTIYSSKDGDIRGTSTYWGDSSDSAGTSNWYDGGTHGSFFLHYQSLSPYERRRGFLRFDLSSIPDGAEITNATLKIYTYRDASGGISMTFNIYKADARAWSGDSNQNFRYYSSSNEWEEYGLKPNIDYTDHILDTFTDPASTAWILQELDVTNTIQEGIEKDTPQADFLIMKNDGDDDVGGVSFSNNVQVYGSGGADVQKRPQLVITYKKPLAFYEADDSGDIDTTKEVFIEDAGKSRVGAVVQDGSGTWDSPTTGSTAKYFIKNERSDIALSNVYVFSSDDRADLPQADSGNTGNGTMSEVSTDPDDTQKEEWEIEFTSATAFTVKRRDMNSNDSYTTDTPGTGTVGTTYTSTDRGISFTITAGGTSFVSGDKFTFRTWPDNSISGAPSDSDDLLQICKDNSGSPDGNWQYIKPPMDKLASSVSGSATITLNSVQYFTPNMRICIFDVSAETWNYGSSGNGYLVSSVNVGSNQLVLNESVTFSSGDWVWGMPINWSNISAGGSEAFWLRGVCISSTTKEMKNQYLDAEEMPDGWPFVL